MKERSTQPPIARRFPSTCPSFAKLLGGFLTGLAGPNATGVPDFDDPAGWQVELIQDGDTGYMRLPALDAQLPEGKSWVRTEEGSKSGGDGFEGFDQLAKSDPRELLETLRAVSGDIETVGSEQLRGVETTHYRAVVDPAELAKLEASKPAGPQTLVDQFAAQSGLGAIPVEVWLDASGLVRKLSMEVTATEPGTTRSSAVSVGFELWDYGEAVEIQLPPAEQVADASALRG